LLQSLLERRDGGMTFWMVRGRIHKHSDPPDRLTLLRARGERQCAAQARAAQTDSDNEFASPHGRPGLKLWSRRQRSNQEIAASGMGCGDHLPSVTCRCVSRAQRACISSPTRSPNAVQRVSGAPQIRGLRDFGAGANL
jgi:hypothetical protein